MKVDANRLAPQVTAQSHHHKTQKIQQPESRGQNKQIEKSAAEPESAALQNRARGAVRLLQEGHFKGVAALRLRINFYDQLSGLEQEAMQATAQESVAELNLAMQEHIDGMGNEGLIDEESGSQLSEIADNFASELQNSITGNKLDPQQLISGFEQGYESFRTVFQNMLLAPAPIPMEEGQVTQTSPTEETPVPVEQSDENHSSSISIQESEQASEETIASPAPPKKENDTQELLNASLDTLDSIFRAQLGSLEERLQEATVLSIPEQPDNEGAAFQKFLSIYQDMQSSAETDNDPDNTAVS